jgi:SAM-dependent methyltransferase
VSERSCNLEALPPSLAARFEPLPPDPDVEAFAAGRPHGALREGARRILRRVMSDFDADGLLGTCPMALLGERSWEALCGDKRGGRLLDVGAGSGDVTVHARSLFREIVTTETSGPMARRLRRRGFTCHRVDLAREPLPGGGKFDVVALLDVIDRCDRPRSLLKAAASLLAPDGRLLVSVPLPVRPHVDVGGHTVDPDEPITGSGETWEEALADLIDGTIEPAGLEVRRIARAPYLSIGASGLTALDAALLVCG